MKSIIALCSIALTSAASFDSESPESSFLRQSSNKNAWDYDNKHSWAVCILGYTVFIVTYLFVVVAILYDAISKIREYTEMIEDDKKTLENMNYDTKDPDFILALENRLKGIKEEDGADD